MIPFAYNYRNLRVRWKTTLMTASGFTLVVAALVAISYSSEGALGSAILCCGIILVVVGAISFPLHSSATRHWQETTGTQLSAIEKDIAQRQRDIDGHRGVVA